MITGTPPNSRLDSVLQLFSNLDFQAKQNALKALAPGAKQTLENIKALSSETGVALAEIQAWLSEPPAPELQGDDADAFNELASIANGQELDISVLREALKEAYQVELAILGKLGPPEQRAQLVREIYALKLANPKE